MSLILEKLWLLTGHKRSGFTDEENLALDIIGLNLITKPKNMGYWCTPVNTVTFASTGGDGVHFGFLTENNEFSDDSPIIMTLPCADTSNIVVGENINDFLSLGCKSGFFELEQIEYKPDEQIPLMDSGMYSNEATTETIEVLQVLQNNFHLENWKNHKNRLAELRLEHFGKLKYSDEYYEITT